MWEKEKILVSSTFSLPTLFYHAIRENCAQFEPLWNCCLQMLSIGSKILSCVNSFHWPVYLSPTYFHRTTWVIFEIFNLIYVLSVLSIVFSMLVNLYYNAINKQWKEGEFKSVTQWRIPEDVDTCFSFNPFPNKPWFLRVCSRGLLKTLWEKEKLLITSNFSFSHSVF